MVLTITKNIYITFLHIFKMDILFETVAGKIYTGHVLIGTAQVPSAVFQHGFKL
jgi:hypothetical protein